MVVEAVVTVVVAVDKLADFCFSGLTFDEDFFDFFDFFFALFAAAAINDSVVLAVVGEADEAEITVVWG